MYLVETQYGARYGGLGDAAQQVQLVSSIGTPIVLGGVSAAAASSAAAAGTAATILGMAPALAVPIIGAAIVGLTLAVVAILRSGCGQSCIVTSEWANEAEKLLAQNIAAYFASPRRTRSQQKVALANYDSVWNYLAAQCGQAGLSTAGKNCIDDRKAGSCKWRQTSTSPLLAYPGEPRPGECWNWFSGYRDPIANDPDVVDDSAAILSQVESSFSGAVASASAATGLSPLALAAGLALVVVAGVAIT